MLHRPVCIWSSGCPFPAKMPILSSWLPQSIGNTHHARLVGRIILRVILLLGGVMAWPKALRTQLLLVSSLNRSVIGCVTIRISWLLLYIKIT